MLLSDNQTRFNPLALAASPAWWGSPQREGYSDSASMPTLSDWSGNNNQATQATVSSRAVFVANAFGSKPAFRFNGTSNQYLLNAAVTLPSATLGWTIITVIKASGADGILFGHTTLDRRIRILPSANQINCYETTQDLTNNAPGINNTAKVIAWRCDSSGKFRSYINGSLAQLNPSPLALDLNLNRFGQQIGLFLNADVGDTIVYARDIGATTIGAISAGWQAEYKLP